MATLCLGCVEPTSPNARIPRVADSLFGPGNTRWFIADTMGGGGMPPLIDGEWIYVARAEFKQFPEIAALSRATGETRWRQRQLTFRDGPALAGEILGVPFGGLNRFNRTTGAQAPMAFFGAVPSNVVSDGTRFYVGVDRFGAAAVNAATGAAEWQTSLGLPASGSIAPFGIALAGDDLAVVIKYFPPAFSAIEDSGMVARLDRATGTMKWRRSFAGGTWSSGFIDPPVISGSVIGVVTDSHMVYGLDLATGDTRWTYDATRGDPGHASPGIAGCDGTIFVSDGNLGLVSLNAETGAENWRLPDLQIGSLYSLQCSYGTVMALASYLKVFDARSGVLLRRVPSLEHMDSFIMSAARDERSIYVTGDRGIGAMKAP